MGARFCRIDDDLDLVRTVAAGIVGVRFCRLDDDLDLVVLDDRSRPDEETVGGSPPLCLPCSGPVLLALVRVLRVDKDRREEEGSSPFRPRGALDTPVVIFCRDKTVLGSMLVGCVSPRPSPPDEDEGVRLVEELGLLRCRIE